MAKTAASYQCSECGATSLRWLGRCSRCQAYGTVAEVAATQASHTGLKGKGASTTPTRPAQNVASISPEAQKRVSTGLAEVDRVIGGGMVTGQVVLLAGEPGVGKSTLLLMIAERYAATGKKVLYVSAEESAEQVAVRARRIGANAPTLLIADETDLDVVVGHIEQTDPDLVIVDSVQTVASPAVDGRAGGVSQVQEVAQTLTRVAKSRSTPLFLVGQSTKDNAVAGPRTLEHLVDTVLTFEGDRNSPIRLLRAVKNRFGAADEIVAFEQIETGLAEVADPSSLFRMERDQPVPGTCVAVTLEGRRTMLAEVQALFSPGIPPRTYSTGLDSHRVITLAAVAGSVIGDMPKDRSLFVATVAGARLDDPGVDFAICLAIASAHFRKPVPDDLIAIGEVALSGDIRPVPSIDQRIAEAQRLGFKRILIPAGGRSAASQGKFGDIVKPISHLSAAFVSLKQQPR